MEQILQDKIINIPNLLTVVRIGLLPVVAWCFRMGNMAGALAAYVAAMLTDAVDGFIARKFNQITSLGKLLDPIADKLSLITIIGLFVMDGQIPLWVLLVIVLKELLLLFGGAIALKNGIIVYALPIGKVTTIAFVASVIARFLGLTTAADALLYISVALSMVALVWYTLDLLNKMGRKKGDSTKIRH